MSFSAGVFSINTAGQPVVSGTTISSVAFNALTADLATGLSTCLLKDGSQTATARIPFAAGISVATDILGSTSTLSLKTAGGTHILLENISAAVNYWSIFGAATGNNPTISLSGSDTNISSKFVTKGSGTHNFYTNTSDLQVSVSHTASATRWVTLTGSNGGNPTIDVSAGSLNLASLVLMPSGATVGSLGTTGGGNITAGVVATRSVTNPSNSINIFNGTAPSGTLTNGVTLYSASGKLWAMDAGGNATQLTP